MSGWNNDMLLKRIGSDGRRATSHGRDGVRNWPAAKSLMFVELARHCQSSATKGRIIEAILGGWSVFRSDRIGPARVLTEPACRCEQWEPQGLTPSHPFWDLLKDIRTFRPLSRERWGNFYFSKAYLHQNFLSEEEAIQLWSLKKHPCPNERALFTVWLCKIPRSLVSIFQHHFHSFCSPQLSP